MTMINDKLTMILMMTLSRVDGSYLCPDCELPLCGEQCRAGPWHRPECEIFSRSEFFDVFSIFCHL